ncbi:MULTISPECIES: response regulator transcription factor [unclassified Exiguobacterium]|uniref:response regulator transcription factor n=1 Tax=unclassified Exiguobacterium TaxID=2644629 RepID=UPI000646E62A|nr:response regulator transcription factor [Exiguobacterium sp. ZOR0005]
MHILIVEDDRTIASGLQYSLEQEQFTTTLCQNVADATRLIDQQLHTIDLYLFDLSLPDGSGYDLCRLVKQKHDTPVIFLTAFDDEVNVVMGLDMGADDYITKPFRVRELISRIHSVLRRYNKQASSPILTIGSVEINPQDAKVKKDGHEILLTALEYRLLLIFGKHTGQVLSRAQLLDQMWDVGGDFVNDNTLTVYIKRLREKLEDDPQHPTLIKTIRGIGYKVEG